MDAWWFLFSVHAEARIHLGLEPAVRISPLKAGQAEMLILAEIY